MSLIHYDYLLPPSGYPSTGPSPSCAPRFLPPYPACHPSTGPSPSSAPFGFPPAVPGLSPQSWSVPLQDAQTHQSRRWNERPGMQHSLPQPGGTERRDGTPPRTPARPLKCGGRGRGCLPPREAADDGVAPGAVPNDVAADAATSEPGAEADELASETANGGEKGGRSETSKLNNFEYYTCVASFNKHNHYLTQQCPKWQGQNVIKYNLTHPLNHSPSAKGAVFARVPPGKPRRTATLDANQSNAVHRCGQGARYASKCGAPSCGRVVTNPFQRTERGGRKAGRRKDKESAARRRRRIIKGKEKEQEKRLSLESVERPVKSVPKKRRKM